ncbi:hypothetical protein QJ527_12815 [Enterococcus mundtii]|uniref:hypothetical protein n=1 Tax=Enterococcus TaxID=1350 RepID=UPI00044BF294|nr:MULTISPECIES: hypothetical protein [Enterococcus]AZP92088.1 hypothetical protein CYK55_02670 [Enterococcus mundtii]EYT94854.1 hypothetical protein AK89_11505 [Enterococcus mundtii CRL35]MDA9429837.1 hypothetical protein [Enterococcus mundtii 1A]MDK4212410.1 hypothetical protein [Enterococcus mundtii]MDO7880288.1 hypothetical protein [Enterococcus mundtii]
MTYVRIFKIIQLGLLALSIYFAAMKNTIYTTLIMLSLFIEYVQYDQPKTPYKSGKKAIYLPNQISKTEVMFALIPTILVLMICSILELELYHF